MVLIASAPAEALRTYEADLEGGKLQPTGHPAFRPDYLTHHRSSSFEAAGLLIRERDLLTL